MQSIFIVGLMGNGLRSIGNSILGETKFNTGVYDDDGYEIDMKEVDAGENSKRVIIFPLKDSNLYTKEQKHQDKIKEFLETCQGFDAIVFVLKYGVRFTQQEKDAVEKTKKIFGKNVFSEHVIVAFSHGDTFELGLHYQKDISELFQHWCQQQTGEIEKLFAQVKYRCVLFDNKCKDEDIQKSQAASLFSLIRIQENDALSKKLTDNTSTRRQEKIGIENQAQEKHKKYKKHIKLEKDNECTFEDVPTNNEDITINKRYTLKDFENNNSKYFWQRH